MKFLFFGLPKKTNSNAIRPFPNFVLSVADEIEIANFPALAKGLGADEVGVGQVAVVDDVRVTEHRAEAVNHAVFREDVLIETLGTLEMELVGAVGVLVPHILPALARAHLEPQGHHNLHQRDEITLFGQLLHLFGLQ